MRPRTSADLGLREAQLVLGLAHHRLGFAHAVFQAVQLGLDAGQGVLELGAAAERVEGGAAGHLQRLDQLVAFFLLLRHGLGQRGGLGGLLLPAPPAPWRRPFQRARARRAIAAARSPAALGRSRGRARLRSAVPRCSCGRPRIRPRGAASRARASARALLRRGKLGVQFAHARLLLGGGGLGFLELRAQAGHAFGGQVQAGGDLAQGGVAQVGLVQQDVELGLAQFVGDGLGAARLVGLARDAPEVPFDFEQHVVQARQVLFHALQLAQRDLLAFLVLVDAGGLFEEHAPVLGVGFQQRGDAALLDDRVAGGADAGVPEQLAHVAQAAERLVDQVFAVARAVQAARDRDFRGVQGQFAGGVVESQRNFGEVERLALAGAVEDDVLHFAAAQALGGLLAQHPLDRVNDVGLAAAVRADKGDDAALKIEDQLVRERLEAKSFQPLKMHYDGAPGQAPPPERTVLSSLLPACANRRNDTSRQEPKGWSLEPARLRKAHHLYCIAAGKR